jgi:hypothetical protein
MLLGARALLLQRAVRLGQALGTLAHPGELTLRLGQVVHHLWYFVFLETFTRGLQLPEELVIGILKGHIEFRVLPRPTQHLSSKP